MSLNTELLLRVADAIEANPDHFNITVWLQAPPAPTGRYLSYGDIANELRSGEVRCGTTACIAGWAVALSDTGPLPDLGARVADVAADLLGLDPDGELCADLFGLSDWYFGHDMEDDDDGHVSPATAAQVIRHVAAHGVMPS